MTNFNTTRAFFWISLIAELIFLGMLTYMMIICDSRAFIIWFFVLAAAITHATLLYKDYQIN